MPDRVIRQPLYISKKKLIIFEVNSLGLKRGEAQESLTYDIFGHLKYFGYIKEEVDRFFSSPIACRKIVENRYNDTKPSKFNCPAEGTDRFRFRCDEQFLGGVSGGCQRDSGVDETG